MLRHQHEPAADPRPELVAAPPMPPLRRDAPALLLLGCVLLLEIFSWWLCDGYQLADEVEYMEHAQAMVRGEHVTDSTTIRAFGFSAVLAPLFWIADVVGVEDFKPIVWLVRLLQISLGLWLVRIAMRIAHRIGGRGAALGAAVIVGFNPVFLQYAVSPVSGLAAGVALGEGIDALLGRRDARRGLRAGLWLGVGILMAYQSLIIVGPAVLAAILRDRSNRRYIAAILGGLVLAVLAQVVFDRIVHGEWGATLVRYFLRNASSTVAYWLNRAGFTELALDIYSRGNELREEQTTVGEVRSLTPRTWYFVHITEFLVWPLLVACLVGIARALRRPSFTSLALLAILAVNIALMSNKASKDFRLWLPLLPMIGAFGGIGLARIGGGPDERAACVRRLAVIALVIAGGWLGVEQLWARNTRKFSGYWEAMELACRWTHDSASAGPETRKPRVASAYHWAVYLRESADIELVKLPWQLDQWAGYDAERRMDDLVAIADADWFIVHLPVLTNHPELMRAVNTYFQVAACFWDHVDFEEIGPVFLLRRHRGADGARRFFEVIDGAEPATYATEHGLGEPVRFVRRLTLRDPATGEIGDHLERIDFLGFDYEVLPGDGHGWLTYHWACRSPIFGDYTIVDRLTTPDERYAWQGNHAPAYGVHPTQSSLEGGWQEGWIVRESWPVIAAADPYEWREPFRPIGSDWRRGDLMPATLWMDLATFGPDAQDPERVKVTGRMEPARPGEDAPIRRGELAGVLRTSDGWWFSRDDMVRVGRFFLPVHATARIPDDGRPVPP